MREEHAKKTLTGIHRPGHHHVDRDAMLTAKLALGEALPHAVECSFAGRVEDPLAWRRRLTLLAVHVDDTSTTPQDGKRGLDRRIDPRTLVVKLLS